MPKDVRLPSRGLGSNGAIVIVGDVGVKSAVEILFDGGPG